MIIFIPSANLSAARVKTKEWETFSPSNLFLVVVEDLRSMSRGSEKKTNTFFTLGRPFLVVAGFYLAVIFQDQPFFVMRCLCSRV